MTATADPMVAGAPHASGPPTWGSLLSAESLRLRSRRLILVGLLAAVGIMAIAVIGTFVGSGEPSAQQRADAARAASEAEAQCRRDLKDQVPPAELDEACAVPDDAFVGKQPFTWQGGYREGTLAVAAGVAALMFLIGASAGGAEWGARTMPALLYWEPRRLRVVAVKCLALAVLAIAVALAAQLLWLGAASLLEALRGPAAPPPLPDGFWLTSAGIALRGAVLAMVMGLLAFGLANLTRNTAAALGIAFVYFAVVENVIGFLRPGLVRWQVATNVAALLSPGGATAPTGSNAAEVASGSPEFIEISGLRGGIVLTVLTLLVLVVASALFQRRDIS